MLQMAKQIWCHYFATDKATLAMLTLIWYNYCKHKKLINFLIITAAGNWCGAAAVHMWFTIIGLVKLDPWNQIANL